MNKTFYVRDSEVWERTVDKAAREGRSVSEVIVTLLKVWIAGEDDETIAEEKLSRIRQILES